MYNPGVATVVFFFKIKNFPLNLWTNRSAALAYLNFQLLPRLTRLSFEAELILKKERQKAPLMKSNKILIVSTMPEQ